MSVTELAFSDKQRKALCLGAFFFSVVLFALAALAYHYKQESNAMWDNNLATFDASITGAPNDDKLNNMRTRYMTKCKADMIMAYPATRGAELIPRKLRSEEIQICYNTAMSLHGTLGDELVIVATDELITSRKELYEAYFVRCKAEGNTTELYCHMTAFAETNERLFSPKTN